MQTPLEEFVVTADPATVDLDAVMAHLERYALDLSRRDSPSSNDR